MILCTLFFFVFQFSLPDYETWRSGRRARIQLCDTVGGGRDVLLSATRIEELGYGGSDGLSSANHVMPQNHKHIHVNIRE